MSSGKRSVVARNQPADDLGLARRLMRGDAAAGAALVRGDAGNDLDALEQKVLQPVVDLVDASAQAFEVGRNV